jgi:hypothetical protein
MDVIVRSLRTSVRHLLRARNPERSIDEAQDSKCPAELSEHDPASLGALATEFLQAFSRQVTQVRALVEQ